MLFFRQAIFSVFLSVLSCVISATGNPIDTSSINKKIVSGEKYEVAGSDSSILLLKIAMEEAELSGFVKGLFRSGLSLADIYKKRGLYYDAIKTVNYMIAYSKKIRNSYYEAYCFYMLGEIYRASYSPEEALKYLNVALCYFRNSVYEIEVSRCYNRFSAVYFEIKKDSLSERYADSSNIIALKYNDLKIIANNEELLAAVNRSMGNYKHALEHLKNALNTSIKLGDSTDIPNILNNFGYTYIMMKDFDMAIRYAEESFEMSRNKDILPYKIAAAQILSMAYMAKQDIITSYYYSHISDSISFSSQTSDKKKIMMDLTEKYEFEKNQRQRLILEKELNEADSELNRQSILLWAAIIILLIVLSEVIIVLKGRKRLISLNRILNDQKEELNTRHNELQKAHEELISLQMFRDSMTGMIVHDLLNPLSMIISPPVSLTSDEQVEMMKQSGYYMTTLVTNILDIQKFESHQVKVNAVDIRLNHVVNEAFRHLFMLQRQKQISLFSEVSMDVFVKADRDLLVRILMNLVANAIKFSDPGKGVWVSAEKKGEMVHISVKDNGRGIPKDVIGVVFEKYIQYNAIDSGPVRSMGLGLAFCKMAVEAHGGNINVQSDPGNETVFYFALPSGERKTDLHDDYKNYTQIPNLLHDVNSCIALRPFIKELKSTSIYKITEFNNIVSKISDLKEPGIAEWIAELKNAVYSGNSEMYYRLLQSKDNSESPKG